MAAHSYIKAGVALASAAMIAAIPAIAPPLSPGDYRTLQASELQLSAAAQDLINVFFGDGPLVDPDAPGTAGFSGVIYRMLWAANVPATPAQDTPKMAANRQFLDDFFTGGITEVLHTQLVAGAPTPRQAATIDAFFNGGVSEVFRQSLIAKYTPATPAADTVELRNERDKINAFFASGAAAYLGTALLQRYTPVDPNPATEINEADTPELVVQRAKIAAFYGLDATGDTAPGETGLSGFIYQSLLADNQGNTPEEIRNRVILDSFFKEGLTGLAKTTLVAGASSEQNAEDIEAYFDGGISGLLQTRLIRANTPADPALDTPRAEANRDLINEFFNNGFAGVARLVLAGPIPEAEPTLAVQANEFDVTPSEGPQPSQDAAGFSAPNPGNAAPQSGPVAPVDDPAPKFTAKLRETPVDDQTPTSAGNLGKAEPGIIIDQGSPKAGSTGWGAFGQVADAIQQVLKKKPKPVADAEGEPHDDGSDGAEG